MTDIEDRILAVLSGPGLRRYLGPRDPAEQLAHTLGFADAAVGCLGRPPRNFADLGAGGGVPGLALAALWSDCEAVLIESAAGRCAALEEAARELGVPDRVKVLVGRAERWGHDPEYRESVELVTARSFARPAVTAEIATGLVELGGTIIVSDPPEPNPLRWPSDKLGELGLGPARAVIARGAHFSCLVKLVPAATAVPAPDGRPGKRPRW